MNNELNIDDYMDSLPLNKEEESNTALNDLYSKAKPKISMEEFKKKHQEQFINSDTPKEKKELLSRLHPIKKIIAFVGTAIATIVPIYNATHIMSSNNSEKETVSTTKIHTQKQHYFQKITSKKYTASDYLDNQRTKKYEAISMQVLESIINENGIVSFEYTKNEDEAEIFLAQDTLDSLYELLGDQTEDLLNFLQALNNNRSEISSDQLLSIITELSQTEKDILEGGFTEAFKKWNFNTSEIYELLRTARNTPEEQLFILNQLSASVVDNYITDSSSFIDFFQYISKEKRLNYKNYELILNGLNKSEFSKSEDLETQIKEVLQELQEESVTPGVGKTTEAELENYFKSTDSEMSEVSLKVGVFQFIKKTFENISPSEAEAVADNLKYNSLKESMTESFYQVLDTAFPTRDERYFQEPQEGDIVKLMQVLEEKEGLDLESIGELVHGYINENNLSGDEVDEYDEVDKYDEVNEYGDEIDTEIKDKPLFSDLIRFVQSS
jgi:hypothetical protein